jgi:zinc/manganese transport system substrate-binding protein
MSFRRVLAVTASVALALGLAGCASNAAKAGGDGRLNVVASTDVYGQLAEQIGGDLVSVTSIVHSASQDPHSFEPSARDQLLVSHADLIIGNGGGYDAFVAALVESSGSAATVLTAVEYSDAYDDQSTGDHAAGEHEAHDHASEDHDHAEGVNEHVWYDPHTMQHLADEIAAQLSERLPEGARTFAANAKAFAADTADLEQSLDGIRQAHAGDRVFATEPVPGYLLTAAGLESVTPDAFSEAVEEGQDVPPATLLEALDLLKNGDVRVVIANTQTGGAETSRVIDDAEAHGIPVLNFTETLPDGQTYVAWMQSNIEALAGALDR